MVVERKILDGKTNPWKRIVVPGKGSLHEKLKRLFLPLEVQSHP